MLGLDSLLSIGRILNIAMIAIAAYSMVLNLMGGADKGTRIRGYWIFLASIFVFFDLFLFKTWNKGPLFILFNNLQLSMVPFLLLFVVADLEASTKNTIPRTRAVYRVLAIALALAINTPGFFSYEGAAKIVGDLAYNGYVALCFVGSLPPLVLYAVWTFRGRGSPLRKLDNALFMLLYAALVVAMVLDGTSAIIGADGTFVPLSVFAVFGLALYGIVSNAVRFKLIDDRTRFYALHDELTGTFKRSVGVERIEGMIARKNAPPFSVILIDFNNFKKINDVYGYGAGNACLAEVARRLRAKWSKDGMVFRTEGDEFMILAEGIHDSPARSPVLAHVFDGLSEPVRLDGNKIEVSLRAGVSHYPEHGQDASQLLRNADDCLGAAKRRAGPKCAVYDDAMRREKVDYSTTEFALKSVLDSPVAPDAFPLHFQPKVDRHGKVRALEGLVRWRHGSELVPPGRFIAVAERSGLINDIGRHVIEAGCRALREWRQERGCDLTISINIAPRQVEDPALLGSLLRAIDAHGIDPASLEIELTESTIMDPAEEEKIVGFLAEVSRQGIRTSIDDFGTGYSSFSRIVDLPVDVIKIDRSIAMHSGREGKSRRVCRSLIQLAHELGMEVVAEGVDDHEQADFLFDQGCDLIQGFYFYKPLPAAGIEGLIAEGIVPAR